ncbi:MAG: aldo/keto reductase [Spirochaetia bacterium]|nr:aldo/keto reductase [Spirochaetia bacterium]
MIYSPDLVGKKNSFIGLGTWRFGEDEDPSDLSDPMRCYWGGQKRSDSIKTLHAALRNGITHFDTAQVYGNGKSEQLVGQELRKIRDQVIIADKFMPYNADYSSVEKKVELSLRRLNTEYIDIMYIHWPVCGVENAVAAESLERLRQSGKIRFIGVSNMDAGQICDAMRGGTVDFCQIGYNILWRRSELDVIPLCRENGIHLVAYGFLGQGLFAGSHGFSDDGNVPGDARKKLVFYGNNASEYRRLYRQIEILAAENDMSPAVLLLSWGRRKNIFDTILTGASARWQIDENCQSCMSEISDSLFMSLEKISADSMKIYEESGNIFCHRI